MEKSDVACFAQQCGAQTKALFSNPAVSKASVAWVFKGEQSCATRCLPGRFRVAQQLVVVYD
jgi:hypothetical protein